MDGPFDHVLAAFGLGGDIARPLSVASRRVWRCGDAVLRPVANPVEAAWSAGVFETVRVTGIRVARPIRSTDGRWVVGGWSAQRFVSGHPAPRYAEVIDVSRALSEALAGVGRPKFLSYRDDLVSQADALAWGESDDVGALLEQGHGRDLFDELANGARPLSLSAQIIHGDLFGGVLFAGAAPPAVTGFVPLWRPADYASAIVTVDAISWGDASADLIDTFDTVPYWRQLVRRAVMFRLALSLAHPRSTPESLVAMLTAADVIRPLLD